MKKAGRNDPCPCGSGRKFKKCCESKMIGGRFMATRVSDDASQQIKKTVNLTSFFNARLAETPKKPMPPVSPLEGDGSQLVDALVVGSKGENC